MVQNLATGDHYILDVTVRNPATNNYFAGEQNTIHVAGHACKVAEAEKQKRYPTRDDWAVVCLAAESFGRLLQTFDDLLSDIGALACTSDALNGRPVRRWKSWWLSELSCVLAKAAAQSRLEAAGSIDTSKIFHAQGERNHANNSLHELRRPWSQRGLS